MKSKEAKIKGVKQKLGDYTFNLNIWEKKLDKFISEQPEGYEIPRANREKGIPLNEGELLLYAVRERQYKVNRYTKLLKELENK